MDKCMHMVIHTLHYLTLHHITSHYIKFRHITSQYIQYIPTVPPTCIMQYHYTYVWTSMNIWRIKSRKKNNMCIHMACMYCSAAFTSFMVNSETGTSETCWSNKKNSAASLGHDVTIWVDYQRALAKHKQNPHFNSDVWHLCCIWS